MDKDLTLDDIYEGLMKGQQYILKDALRSDWQMFKKGTLRFFVPGGFDEIHLTHSQGKDYFSYNHYGSSARTAEKDELKWIIETIFKKQPSDFTVLDIHALMGVINEGR